MTKKLVDLGIRLKFRTELRDGRPTAFATMWVEGEPLQELATLDLVLLAGPGDPTYQRWVDAVDAAFLAFLKRETEVDGFVSKRRKAKD